MNTLIISSSLSKKSRSFILCTEISNRLSEKGINVEFVDARDMELLPSHFGSTESMKDLS